MFTNETITFENYTKILTLIFMMWPYWSYVAASATDTFHRRPSEPNPSRCGVHNADSRPGTR